MLETVTESSPTYLLTTWELVSPPGVLAQPEVGVLQPEPLVLSVSGNVTTTASASVSPSTSGRVDFRKY